MSKFDLKKLWEEIYGNKKEVEDYTGRRIVESAIGNQNSKYCPTIDHIKPISKEGKDIKGNIVICNIMTNEEKGDNFPHWKANGKKYKAKKVKGKSGEYDIYLDE